MVSTCSGWIEPLDLECLLVNNLAGSLEIFTMISFIVISIVAARFRMMNNTLMVIYALFAVIMSVYVSGVYFIVILIAGLVVAFGIGRIAKV
jgi:hypothetical protein